MELNSNNFTDIYNELGLNLDKLGCVMVKVEPMGNIWTIEDEGAAMGLYYAKNKDRFWIDGWVAGKTPHITLLYGLLNGSEKYYEQVLGDWKLDEVEIDHVGFFESPYEDEPYYCIVAHIKVTENLLEGHHRLEFLPHINSFIGYKPHVTIAYIKKDEMLRNALIGKLNQLWKDKKLSTTGFMI